MEKTITRVLYKTMAYLGESAKAGAHLVCFPGNLHAPHTDLWSAKADLNLLLLTGTYRVTLTTQKQ